MKTENLKCCFWCKHLSVYYDGDEICDLDEHTVFARRTECCEKFDSGIKIPQKE